MGAKARARCRLRRPRPLPSRNIGRSPVGRKPEPSARDRTVADAGVALASAAFGDVERKRPPTPARQPRGTWREAVWRETQSSRRGGMGAGSPALALELGRAPGEAGGDVPAGDAGEQLVDVQGLVVEVVSAHADLPGEALSNAARQPRCTLREVVWRAARSAGRTRMGAGRRPSPFQGPARGAARPPAQRPAAIQPAPSAETTRPEHRRRAVVPRALRAGFRPELLGWVGQTQSRQIYGVGAGA